MKHTEYPRQFVKPRDALSSWEQIEPYLNLLLSAANDTPEKLNQWLLDCSELAACIDEVGTDRYVKMTCQTDDEARKAAYLDYVENIEPKCKPKWHELDKRFVSSPAVQVLPGERFEVLTRSVRNQVELYREENVALEVEEAKLQQKFQETSAAMTVEYEGREQTLQQLSIYLERTDRAVRQQVWELSSARRLQDADVLEGIFDGLFKLRHQIAGNAGFDDFRGYAFRAKERFDYTPEDCLAFHDAIEKTCVPLMRGEADARKRKLGVEVLRPWDLAVDVKGRAPLRPFESPEELVQKCVSVFDRLHPDFGAQFREMVRQGRLDLESRKGKAPGGYQSTYQETRQPFIFMNAVGMHRDVRTLIHEGGHAFHTLACRHDPLVTYRRSPLEFAEVASMGMEMLAYEHFDVFYSAEELARARRNQLEGVISVLPWVATIDAFQHWMYTKPGHSREERRAYWVELQARFGGLEDYSGYEEALARGWQKQLHLFEVPFYYIEYAIAQLGALQLWRNARENRGRAIELYRRALALGGSRPLPELFESAGIRFDFTTETLGPLMEAVQAELESLPD